MDKRMDQNGAANTDQVSFDNLHSLYFTHRPNPTAPTALDAEQMYPDTYFFRGDPVFFTNARSQLSRNELHQAYNLFGRVHVADVERQRFLTIFPGNARRTNLNGYYDQHERTWEVGLDDFVRRVQATERVYGKSVAQVLFGAPFHRSAVDLHELIRQYRNTVPFSEIQNAASIPDHRQLSSTELRERLRRDGFIKVSSEDGNASLGLRFDMDGRLSRLGFGTVDRDLLEHL